MLARGNVHLPAAGYRRPVAIPDPLLVFGPRSTTYDFGPAHPLTPRRFGPGISLLESLGAVPGLAPQPASDEELLWIHEQAYLETVKDFHVIAVAASGEEAVKLVSEHIPDIVLLDLIMPGMDGVETTRRIKLISPRTQVVVLTSLSRPALNTYQKPP